jgi:hypothetical protein
VDWISPTVSRIASHGSTAGRRDYLAGRLLVVGQITIAMIVVVSSGLMLRSLWNLHVVDPGFKTDGRLTFAMNLTSTKYSSVEVRSAFVTDIVDRVHSLPGVRSAAASHRLPMSGQSGTTIRLEGKPEPRPGESMIVIYRSVTPDYFDVMGMPIVRGRMFDPRESRENQAAVVVNQRMADRFWPGEDALGKRFQSPSQNTMLTV